MDKSLLKPKYWFLWSFIIIIKALLRILPYSALMKLSICLGRLAKPLMKRRNNIAVINLKIAFPEKSEEEIHRLAERSYRSACMAGMESMMAWFMPKKQFDKIKFNLYMDSYIKAYQDKSRPLIILGFHFHCLEISGRFIGEKHDEFSVMYQKNKNPLMEHLITSSRSKYLSCYNRKNIISVIKALKKRIPLWYAPDQDFREHSIFAPFFSKDCATLTVTPWLAEKTNAVVIPMYYVRRPDLKGYKAITLDPIEFSGDAYEDAKMTNELLESIIRKYPSQYLWQHRRYKTRPEGEEKIY